MLGSQAEAEDAVQEAWLRLARNDESAINDLTGWLTTVVARIALDMLRARRSRREVYPGTWLPEPIVTTDGADPADASAAADALGVALLVVLETLKPAERLAFVLHDVFGVPFDEIAPIVGRNADAARQLASRARRRVRAAPQPNADLADQRRVVDAFVAAARDGRFDALLEVLDPEVSFRIDLGPDAGLPSLVGRDAVVQTVIANAPRFLNRARPVTVNGGPGMLVGTPEQPQSVAALTVVDDRIVAIDVIADPEKLRNLAL
jgi:RNA polymerase sigma-70 factor (ECF subfamily)